jgi:hypothetical protein
MPVRLALGQALATYAFDGFFRGYMFKDVALSSLAQGKEGLPHLIINTTGLEKGQNIYFTPTYVGPDKALAFDPRGGQSIARGEVSLAFAVGASACVPAIFPPSVLPLQPAANGSAVAADPARAHLVDGGVCDNQGIGVFLTEPKVDAERVQYLIVSDASRVLDPEEDGSPPWYYFFFKPLALLSRAHGITEDHARWDRFDLLLHKKQVGRLRQTAFFHTSPLPPAKPGIPAGTGRLLAKLRTDFDSFSDLEITALMYHGYTLVDYRILNHCPLLLDQDGRINEFVSGLRKKREDLPDASVSRDELGALGAATPLKSWPDFSEGIQGTLPPRCRCLAKVREWLEKPWWRTLQERDPANPEQEAAWAAAQAHLERGSINSLVWRGLCRLGDRGEWWKLVSVVLKIVIVVCGLFVLSYLLKKGLALVVGTPLWLAADIAVICLAWSNLDSAFKKSMAARFIPGGGTTKGVG